MGATVDEQWACPKCGFENEYYASYCISCSEPRPAADAPADGTSPASSSGHATALDASTNEQIKEVRAFQAEVKAMRASATAAAPAVRPTPAPAPKPVTVVPVTAAPVRPGTAAPATAPTATSDGQGDPCKICGRRPTALFSFDSNRGMLVARQVFHFRGRLCRTCAQGVYREHQTRNLGWGWFGLQSGISTIAWSINNRRNYHKNLKGLGLPLPADSAEDAKRGGRPILKGILPGLSIFAAVIAAIIVVVVLQGRGKMDQPYIEEFYTTSATRNEVVKLANSRDEVWQATSQDPVPGAQYLVVDELASLDAQVTNMSLPKSDGLRAMHVAWMTAVRKLAAAEKLLTQENTQANLDAEVQAWWDEDATFKPLFNYCKEHDQPE
jgi:hypothetical protein